MTRVEGSTLRAWRRSRGWDVPRMARELRQAAADEPMPVHDALIRMIRGWERGDHRLSERYQLLYRKAVGIPEPPGKPQDPPPARAVLVSPSALSWAVPVYDAVLNPVDATRRAGAGAAVARTSLAALRQAFGAVLRASLASDYGRLAASLPALIGTTELANLNAGGTEQLQQLLSDVYAISAWTLIKADLAAAAWNAAQRALELAEQAGDVLRCAAATRCLSEVHMRAASFGEASRTAFLAATYLDTSPRARRPAALCLRGASLLSASAAAARRGDSREAHASLKAADACAGTLGRDRDDLGTVFGPTNVAIHQVAVAVELGDARTAVRLAPAVDLTRMPAHLTERRARFLIDVARGHAQLREDDAAIGALTEAERISADEVRNHRLTRQVLRDLLTRERPSSGLRDLASRCHAVA
ncbi:MAG: hypothetical protein ACRDRJ_15115 [Streptosporangiaceae bacterium]